MSSSRSRDGPGRFRSGLWDIQHRASVTFALTPSRDESQGIDQRGAQVGRQLRDAGPRDAPIRTKEHDRFPADVEPGFQAPAAVADDDDVGFVVPGPMQLS